MPRLVKKTAHAPIQVGEKFICMCGLSENQPFCDKSHLKTAKEDEDKLYWYENGVGEEIPQEEDDCCGGCGDNGCCGHCHEDEESIDK